MSHDIRHGAPARDGWGRLFRFDRDVEQAAAMLTGGDAGHGEAAFLNLPADEHGEIPTPLSRTGAGRAAP